MAVGIFRKIFGERNRLSGVIFTEAVVQEFKTDGNTAILVLLDYCDSKWEFRFVDVSECWSSDSLLNYEIMNKKLSRTEAGWKASFYDDDHEILLSLVYKDVEVRVLSSDVL